ncbi:N-acetylglucosamine-6-phosphate deacetylase [Dorea sp. D27]|uniref:N-acetylglucosamine-6-phosphate deacetylase n=1 Tax=Dorea sp. D27 TaxID=658665 RepID=UPI0006733959|nr:N-acetylglucosamine-6-phosphate deacetylase [Dorea sp. D27]KMZ52595.1 N-acetylglucosamine-6-phosphate deacetylase [Dorea sp. D27]
MLIKNVKVFTEEKTFEDGEIIIRDGLISEGEGEAGEVIDGEGCYAIPGLIDIHFHGCKGYDFCDGTKEAIREIAKYEASVGVTAMSPATMTLPVETLEEILATAAAYKKEAVDGADLIGVNMEGPFISKVKKGAQDATYIIPCSKDIFRRFQAAAQGLIKYVGVAPEEEGALEFVEQVKDEVNVSLAHTNAGYDDAKAAYDKGACHAVHLYNAMPPFTHRAPGVIGAVSDSGHVMAELICDGVHIHPSVVRATFKMLGADRIILISDSMRATGMPDGEYTLGGLAVDVTGNRATLVSDGALAGSATNLMDCLRTVVKEMGIPLETAVACATMNPAKSLGEYGKYGSITPGKKGNVVLLDKDLNLKAVIKDGKRI